MNKPPKKDLFFFLFNAALCTIFLYGYYLKADNEGKVTEEIKWRCSLCCELLFCFVLSVFYMGAIEKAIFSLLSETSIHFCNCEEPLLLLLFVQSFTDMV